MMKRAPWLMSLSGILACFVAFAGDPGTSHDLTFIKNRKRLPDVAYQYELRHKNSWQQFLAKHGTWYVVYNEETAKPHRAFGKPITINGQTPNERAQNFIQNELQGFGVKTENLRLDKSNPTNQTAKKYDFVNYTQWFNGLKVETSRMTIKMDKQGRVVMWGADIYENINIPLTPAISGAQAASKASEGIAGITGTVVNQTLSILPVPENKSNKYHLVYTVYVNATQDLMPAKYYTLVDAATGEVLYRQNQVRGHKPKTEANPMSASSVKVIGDISIDNPAVAPSKLGFPNMEVNIDGNTYFTDALGNIDFDLTGAGSAYVALSGTWVEVHNQLSGGGIPGANTVVVNGSNTINMENVASLEERSAYYNTNLMHDYQKERLNGFTGLDKKLPANVDITPATCNAFYDGQSINFYVSQDNCYSLAMVADVIFHEYGHGVNNEFYMSLGGSFNNGAMHEGYADTWAFSVYNDPILGNGMNPQNPNEFVRRYDQAPKVYPKDIVAEPHGDGEIIAGAWWDTYLNLESDMDLTMELFAEHYPGRQAEAYDGEEGKAYTDVLLDVLQADDDDGDISNGTPHGAAIAAAFKKHGITLISNAEITHTAIPSASANQGIPVTATLELDFQFEEYLDGMSLYYSLNRNGVLAELPMTSPDEVNYSGTIPAQGPGTLINYYLAVKDNLGNAGIVQPIAAADADANLPYYILVGFDYEGVDDFDFNFSSFGNWTESQPDDNATTGMWEFALPVGSFSTPGDYETAVAPYYQTTQGGDYCYVTQNSNSEGDPIGARDVDGGKTTLESPAMNLTAYINPTITYNRWYTNNPPSGANPGADYWQVQITNDGVNWQYIEATKTSDRSWRRKAFRVRDYIELTDKVQFRFIASDSIRPGENLDGGSLIEAALDDFTLYDASAYTTSVKNHSLENLSAIKVFPNPTAGDLKLELELAQSSTVQVKVTNPIGEVVYTNNKQLDKGKQLIQLPLKELANGIYVLSIQSNGEAITRKFTILH